MQNERNTFSAIEILANAIGERSEKLKFVLENPSYKIFKIPKKSGGKRTIHAPVEETKKIQNIIYKRFLKKIAYNGLIKDYCFGGMPKKSVYKCFLAHSFEIPKFIIDIDLKDAFHCVNQETIFSVFKDLFYREVDLYRKRYLQYLVSDMYEEYLIKKLPIDISVDDVIFDKVRSLQLARSKFNHVSKFQKHTKNSILLFPNRRNKIFREMIRDDRKVQDVYRLCDEMAEILSKLVTHKGVMVQGCPTSPILMALVLSYTRLGEKFKTNFYRKIPGSFPKNYSGISVYVDNITLSDDSHKSKKEVSEALRLLLEEIERETIWKFNWNKIHVYDPMKEQPLLLGMRLLRNRKTRKELKDMTKERIKGARHKLKAWEPWYYFKPTLPKEMQRKIRSAVHKACNSTEEHIQKVAVGYIGYVFNTYKSLKDIPMQIKKPILHYIQNVNSEVLQILHRIRDKGLV